MGIEFALRWYLTVDIMHTESSCEILSRTHYWNNSKQ